MASKPVVEINGMVAPIISPVSVIDAVEGLMTLKAVEAAAPASAPGGSRSREQQSDAGSHTRSPSPVERTSKRPCRGAQPLVRPSYPPGYIHCPAPCPAPCLIPPGMWPGAPSAVAWTTPMLSLQNQQLLPPHHQLMPPHQAQILHPGQLRPVGIWPSDASASIQGPFPLAPACGPAPVPAASRSAEDMWLAASELLKRSRKK